MATQFPTAKETAQRLRDLPQVRRWRDGNYEPGNWFSSPPSDTDGVWGGWGHEVTPSRRGISFLDVNRADPHGVPEQGPGLAVDRGGAADSSSGRYNYQLNKKYQVWSSNLESLLDEAISRQWSATTDIPWDQLEPLPDDLERALCQFVTFLSVVEFGPTDNIPFWMSRIDPAFSEARLFLATQCADESRHTEVFTKRMFANGGGPGIEPFAHSVVDPVPPERKGMPPEVVANMTQKGPEVEFLMYNYVTQMLGESMVLDFFRFGEFLGRNPCDKEIFRRVLQDEARHVSYGTMHIKYYLEHAPKAEQNRALEVLHYLASAAESGVTGFEFLINPNIIEPFAVMAGDGIANIDRGWEKAREFWAKVVDEYLGRCDRAGFPRWDRCLLPREAPF
jgi:hypothetical protein